MHRKTFAAADDIEDVSFFFFNVGEFVFGYHGIGGRVWCVPRDSVILRCCVCLHLDQQHFFTAVAHTHDSCDATGCCCCCTPSDLAFTGRVLFLVSLCFGLPRGWLCYCCIISCHYYSPGTFCHHLPLCTCAQNATTNLSASQSAVLMMCPTYNSSRRSKRYVRRCVTEQTPRGQPYATAVALHENMFPMRHTQHHTPLLLFIWIY